MGTGLKEATAALAMESTDTVTDRVELPIIYRWAVTHDQ
jgi:hypothetical protein